MHSSTYPRKVKSPAGVPETIIFSGGTGRSGTTIIGKLLGQHSLIRASKPLEIKFLASTAGLLDLTYGRRDFIEMKKRKSFLYRLLSSSKYFTRLELERKFRARLQGDWWERAKIEGKGPGLSRALTVAARDEALAELMRMRRRDPERAALTFFETLVAAQSNNRGEPMWIDTSPPNIFNADRISRLIPGAKFIHMKRDGRNTIASVLQEHWGPTDALRAIHWWKNRIISTHHALQQVPTDAVLEIQLEELAHFDREKQYLRLLGFLGIEDEVALRNYFETKIDGGRVIHRKWIKEISEPKFEAKFRRVHAELTYMGIETTLYD